jgi:hypothetical protein
MMKKRRNDRNYIIYQITATNNGATDTYIGLTVARGKAYFKSVAGRLGEHFARAEKFYQTRRFSRYIHDNPNATYEYEIVEIVRGRKAAHEREVGYIDTLRPTLNTHTKSVDI